MHPRPEAGPPGAPPEYRRTGGWWTLACGVAVLGCGLALAQGLLIAGGLVPAGTAARPVDPDRARPRHRGPERGGPE
ncbi:hypothetical protein [Streptomyces sp. NPDC058735]|uniref:hypothetical protein n=1 Tax=unclassified Streptomyces TaxID=2593676 RepID=UPI00368DA078